MSPDEYVADFVASLREDADNNPRHQQTVDGLIGASDFTCRQLMAYIIDKKPPTDPQNDHGWAAFCGSALDDSLQRVRHTQRPHLLFHIKPTVTLRLRDGSDFSFTASPDEVDPQNHEVSDFKSKDGLQTVRREKNTDDHRRQIHLQYWGMVQSFGWPLDGVVRNVFIDRSGKEGEPFVVQEQFSMDVVLECAERLSDALYAVEHKERAEQDKPRSFCDRYCAYVTACRGDEVFYPPIFDKRQIEMIEMYDEAQGDVKVGKAIMDELKPELYGLTGQTAMHQVTSTVQNRVTGPVHVLSIRRLLTHEGSSSAPAAPARPIQDHD